MQEIGFLCALGRGRDILWEILNLTKKRDTSPWLQTRVQVGGGFNRLQYFFLRSFAQMNHILNISTYFQGCCNVRIAV